MVSGARIVNAMRRMPGVDPVEFQGQYQRNLSNVDGDCVRACFASCLGMLYDLVPEIPILEGEERQAGRKWRSWLQGFGMDLDIWLLADRENWHPNGWWIGGLFAEVEGREYAHAVLCYRDQFKWDPRPGFGARPGTTVKF